MSRAKRGGKLGRRPGVWLLLAGLILSACGRESTEGSGDPALARPEASAGPPARSSRSAMAHRGVATNLARLRAATAGYHDFPTALEAGFEALGETESCVVHPELGTAGILYVHAGRLRDPSSGPTRPEILVYIPHHEGRMELVAAGFAVDAGAWHHVHGPDTLPGFAGVPFDPPDPQAGAPLRDAYSLRVWLWQENPAGIFAPFNPALECG